MVPGGVAKEGGPGSISVRTFRYVGSFRGLGFARFGSERPWDVVLEGPGQLSLVFSVLNASLVVAIDPHDHPF